MTVRDLIARLSICNPGATVYLADWNEQCVSPDAEAADAPLVVGTDAADNPFVVLGDSDRADSTRYPINNGFARTFRRMDTSDPPIPEEPEPPENCECCGRKSDDLDKFSGWRHEAGEFDWLCGDCHENARLEE